MRLFLLFVCLLSVCYGRIHKLSIKDDKRRYIPLSTFGFYEGGILEVKVTGFHTDSKNEGDKFGFTLDKTLNDAINPYADSHMERCLLEHQVDPLPSNTNNAAVFFTMDMKNRQLNVNCTLNLKLNIKSDMNRSKRDALSDQSLFPRNIPGQRKKRNSSSTHCDPKIPLIETRTGYFNTNFIIFIENEKEEGLYNLYFHSCPNYAGDRSVGVDFNIKIEERNNGNYLSAGEMPLPALYFMMSLLFFLSGCFWVFILVKSNHTVFKIHYLMAVLVYLKSLSLLFHAINYHFIETKGEHVATWAILFYLTHLLKGSVLVITIVLIGTGWTFIKHLLSERDKKIFMIVIPLQVLENVIKVIIEESEEGDVEHRTWLDVFMLIDLLCCGAILFPVVWSIRYLQEASQIDGKAAINLRKLKLFRHFYIMIVCYIYFTRIIVYLLQMTVSFQYEWLDEMFREMVTYVFFVLTGYKFRPASANPYFQLNTDEDDPDIDIVVSQCGVTEGLSKLSRMASEQNEEDIEVLLLSKRESSHEYD